MSFRFPTFQISPDHGDPCRLENVQCVYGIPKVGTIGAPYRNYKSPNQLATLKKLPAGRARQVYSVYMVSLNSILHGYLTVDINRQADFWLSGSWRSADWWGPSKFTACIGYP